MEKRAPKVYYVPERVGRNAILIFDAGYAGGDVHVYEYKESRSVKEIEEEMKAHLRVDKLSKEAEQDVVNTWIEKNFGLPMSWKLTPE
ncbi:MAG: hypothetical protein QMD13_07110 [Candidatus Bathyarchaeia archaeon]|nr:hypothetical protein [Candidatus Bathyarchaeia archaeon]